jgi:hypothetical protein
VREEDEARETPPVVVAAVALGTAPLPIIGVYTVLFLVHGSVHPVQPPDVTTTKSGEFVAGWVALAIFILLTLALLWFLGARRRWPFVVMQLALLGTGIDFASDATKSGRFVSVLIAITCVIALVFAFAPQSWRHMDTPLPPRLARIWAWRPGRGTTSLRKPSTDLAGSAPATTVEPAGLREQRAEATAGDG